MKKLSLYFPGSDEDILVPHLLGLKTLLQDDANWIDSSHLNEIQRHLMGIVEQAPIKRQDWNCSDIGVVTSTLDAVVDSSGYDSALRIGVECLKKAYGLMEDKIGEWMLNRAHQNVNDSPENLGRAAVMVMNHFGTAHPIGERAGYAVVDLLGHEKIQGNNKLYAQMDASLGAAIVPHSKLARAYETAMNYEAAVQGMETWRLHDMHNYIIPAGVNGDTVPQGYLIM